MAIENGVSRLLALHNNALTNFIGNFLANNVVYFIDMMNFVEDRLAVFFIFFFWSKTHNSNMVCRNRRSLHVSNVFAYVVTLSLFFTRRPNQFVVAATGGLKQRPLQAQISPIVGVADIRGGRNFTVKFTVRVIKVVGGLCRNARFFFCCVRRNNLSVVRIKRLIRLCRIVKPFFSTPLRPVALQLFHVQRLAPIRKLSVRKAKVG